jgi:hypothetical protein
MVIIPVDDLLRMFGDYLGESVIPFDTKPNRLMIHPGSRRLALEVDAPSLREGGAILVDFQIKRFTPVGQQEGLTNAG